MISLLVRAFGMYLVFIGGTLERAKICLGRSRHSHRVRNYDKREFFTAGATKKPTFIVIASTNSSQLLLGWISTPLTTATTRCRVNRDWSQKFVQRHEVSSWFVPEKLHFSSQTRLKTAQKGKPVSGGQQHRRTHGDTALQEHTSSPGSCFAPLIGKSRRKGSYI